MYGFESMDTIAHAAQPPPTHHESAHLARLEGSRQSISWFETARSAAPLRREASSPWGA